MRKGKFGFRYHCGEIYLPLQDSSVNERQLLHMAISSAVIVEILTKIGWVPETMKLANERRENESSRLSNPPLRVGHGVGFLPYLPQIPEATSRHQMSSFKDLARNPDDYIKRALFYMREMEIPVEICLNSNNFLTAESKQIEILRNFLDANMTVVLATDNDGIWPCECKIGQSLYFSVPAEFAGAITGILTNANNKIHAEDIEKILANFPHARFGVRFICKIQACLKMGMCLRE